MLSREKTHTGSQDSPVQQMGPCTKKRLLPLMYRKTKTPTIPYNQMQLLVLVWAPFPMNHLQKKFFKKNQRKWKMKWVKEDKLFSLVM